VTAHHRSAWSALPALAAALVSTTAGAHSASDAYLTLTEQPAMKTAGARQSVVHAQWDIALRDLDFVLKLDDNGDGNIVWAELRKHQQAIAAYAYANLKFSADGGSCRIAPTRQMVDDHADGAYASLMFDVTCPGAPARLTLDYRLFFAIDPSHRAIVVFRSGDNVATSVVSPDKARIELPLQGNQNLVNR
jgi:hypothetical protein